MTLAVGCFDSLQPVLAAMDNLSCGGAAKLLMVRNWVHYGVFLSTGFARSISPSSNGSVFYTRTLTSTWQHLKLSQCDWEIPGAVTTA